MLSGFVLDYRQLSRDHIVRPVVVRTRIWPLRLRKRSRDLEIAHVLFTDIVGYSKLPIHQQRAVVERLNEIVRGTDEFQAAETAGR